MKKIPRPRHIKFSNLQLLEATRNVHALLINQAAEHLQQNELKPNFKSIEYRVNKLLADFEKFQICLLLAIERRIPLYKIIKHYTKLYRKRISRAWLYEFQSRFIKTYVHTCTYTFEKILDKSRTPKIIHCKYNSMQRNEIATRWIERNHFKIFNLSDYLHKLRTVQIPLTTMASFHQTKISFPTLKAIINEYYNKPAKPRKHHKHALLKYLLPFGHIQFDIKIVGARDNKFNIPIYCIDMVDERSGIAYGKAFTQHPKHVLINTFREGYEFYCNYFKIIRTRTDHALDFKKTEALRTGEFNDLLTSLGIIHQYSIWSEPETNGKIENLHKQIDAEVLELINRCNTIEEALEVINKWYVVYNTERTKSYKLWNKEKDKWDTHRMLPIQSLTFDFSQYT